MPLLRQGRLHLRSELLALDEPWLPGRLERHRLVGVHVSPLSAWTDLHALQLRIVRLAGCPLLDLSETGLFKAGFTY